MKDEDVEITFDKSAAGFVLDVAHECGITHCEFCGVELVPKNFGGILQPKMGICKNFVCVFDYVKQRNKENKMKCAYVDCDNERYMYFDTCPKHYTLEEEGIILGKREECKNE